jgi:hypothetical protein
MPRGVRWMILWLWVWVNVLVLLGFGTLRWAGWALSNGWLLAGVLALLVVILLAVLVGQISRQMWRLWRGQTTPRLAQRDLRNMVSNVLMVGRTGRWGE